MDFKGRLTHERAHTHVRDNCLDVLVIFLNNINSYKTDDHMQP